MRTKRRRLTRYLFFFGSPSKWYLGLDITEENRNAVLEWLDDRVKFHTWITSVVMGIIVFLTTLGPRTTAGESTQGLVKVVGLGFMLFSVVVNILCIWSLSNWKYNVRTGVVSDGSRMRLDIELVGAIAIGSLLCGLVLAVMAVVS